MCVCVCVDNRDEAIRQTRALQSQIAAENEQVSSLMRFWPGSAAHAVHAAAAHARLPSLSGSVSSAPSAPSAVATPPPSTVHAPVFGAPEYAAGKGVHEGGGARRASEERVHPFV